MIVLPGFRAVIAPSYRMRLFDIVAMLLALGDTGGDMYQKHITFKYMFKHNMGDAV